MFLGSFFLFINAFKFGKNTELNMLLKWSSVFHKQDFLLNFLHKFSNFAY